MGEGLSGTGPKAGGPHYLRRFSKGLPWPVDRTDVQINTLNKTEVLDLNGQIAKMPKFKYGAAVERLRKVLRGKAASYINSATSVDMGPIDLPGPTGESNQLGLYPIGVVLCMSSDPNVLLGMAVQALSMGNKVVACGDISDPGLQSLQQQSFPLVCSPKSVTPDILPEFNVDAVAADKSQSLKAVRQALASRPGSIIRLVTEANYPLGFCVERALCIDTTAAGGNAALLANSV